MPWHMYMPGSPPGSFFANVSKHWSVPRLRTYKSIQVRVKKRVKKKTWWLKTKCQAKAKEAKASLANYKIKKIVFCDYGNKISTSKRVSKQRTVSQVN